ncbi:Dynamin, GTPase domain [Moorella glycerini]|uniref:Bacterial dynamin-like protein n=1 Tax=Neomoorella stamsii TaxID=1266720 RepID=A0A9X7J355_9FIRM|nr:Bacterial dynamin-like protein [Moorella stamsii]CEP68118.1 Dynamin, GTPase domain [Moorella glycerini]
MSQVRQDRPVKAVPKVTNDAGALFLQTLELLNGLGPEFKEERQKIHALQERLLNERFHLAVLGQFKRGKSTFINALLGDEVLPTAILPLTAVPTFLLWGPEARPLPGNSRKFRPNSRHYKVPCCFVWVSLSYKNNINEFNYLFRICCCTNLRHN